MAALPSKKPGAETFAPVTSNLPVSDGDHPRTTDPDHQIHRDHARHSPIGVTIFPILSRAKKWLIQLKRSEAVSGQVALGCTTRISLK